MMNDEEAQRTIRQGMEELRLAEEYRERNPPDWPELTLTLAEHGYRVTGFTTYTLPLPARLRADTVSALLNELIEPATAEADLLGRCDLSYRAVDDWDGPGQTVAVVLSAPAGVYERLQDKRLYGNIMSVMSTMVCESIGGDVLERKPVPLEARPLSTRTSPAGSGG